MIFFIAFQRLSKMNHVRGDEECQHLPLYQLTHQSGLEDSQVLLRPM